MRVFYHRKLYERRVICISFHRDCWIFILRDPGEQAGIVDSPLAEDAQAWLQRSRVQYLFLKFNQALQAVDKGLTLLDENAPERTAMVELRKKLLRFTAVP